MVSHTCLRRVSSSRCCSSPPCCDVLSSNSSCRFPNATASFSISDKATSHASNDLYAATTLSVLQSYGPVLRYEATNPVTFFVNALASLLMDSTILFCIGWISSLTRNVLLTMLSHASGALSKKSNADMGMTPFSFPMYPRSKGMPCVLRSITMSRKGVNTVVM